MAQDSTISAGGAADRAKAAADRAEAASRRREPSAVLRHLQRLLEREGQRLDVRRTELGEVREAIASLSHEMARTTVVPVADLEAVPADLAVEAIGALMDEVGDGIVRTVSRTVEYGPGLDEERVRDLRERLDRGQVVQAIYPLSALDTPAGLRWVTTWAEVGERQRFVPEPPSEFLIAGTSAVLACAEWNVPQSDYVIIREPMIVAAFTALHEMAYASGIALGAAEAAEPVEDRLIDLMALGLKDEVIARTLGCSLRTVRRRIAALMDQHGVTTRFQLGAALLARGRLEAGPLPLSPIRATAPARRKR